MIRISIRVVFCSYGFHKYFFVNFYSSNYFSQKVHCKTNRIAHYCFGDQCSGNNKIRTNQKLYKMN